MNPTAGILRLRCQRETINREDFGVSWGKNFGFDMKVKLAIQVEAGNRPKLSRVDRGADNADY